MGIFDTQTVQWDFPDNTSSTAWEPSFTFLEKGDYQVHCTVTDDDGGVGNDTFSIHVENRAPLVLDYSTEVSGSEGSDVNFSIEVWDAGILDDILDDIDWDGD